MKVSTWTNARRKLKKEFERRGQTRCELCNAAFPLSFAHRYKRRFITTDAEIMTVALLCIPCHQKIEVSGHEQMFKSINQIIEARNENE